MKKFRIITAMSLVALLGFTSCDSDDKSEYGSNPNSKTSTAANDIKQVSMYDGSFDDFLDGASCSSIVLPATAVVNGTSVKLFTAAQYQQVISILGKYNDDQDSVVFQFPLTVKTSNYTEVVVNNQAEYNAILNACSTAERQGKDAVSCVKYNFPITLITYDLAFEQTGSIIIRSNQQLYAYMTDNNSNELFTVSYPVTVTYSDNTTATINSDAELKNSMNMCSAEEDAKDKAAAEAKKLEKIMVNGAFKLQSYVNIGIDKTSEFKDYTIDFTNDYKVKATKSLIATVNGTYAVTSDANVFLAMNFSGDANFGLLNHKWKVTSFTSSSITLQSTTNSAIVVVLRQI